MDATRSSCHGSKPKVRMSISLRWGSGESMLWVKDGGVVIWGEREGEREGEIEFLEGV